MNTDTIPARRRSGDEKIIAALADGKSYGAAAEAAGVSYRTVQRRMADPLFRAEVGELRRLRAEQSGATTERVETLALVELEQLLGDGNVYVRRDAVKIALDAAARRRETDVGERLAALEERARGIAAAQSGVG